MEILYDKKKFIGAIDFYDKTKGFGFIAMNDKILENSSYFINESSFAEQFKSFDHNVVVFQIALQKTGKTKAINVRRITGHNNDIKLALEYFPDSACIRFKNGGGINIFKNVFFPSAMFVDHIASIIRNDENRSAQTTFQHFLTLIDSYPNNWDYQRANAFGDSDVGCAYVMREHDYIYSWDLDHGQGEPWIRLFSELTPEECFEILNGKYWSVCKLIKREDVLEQWFENEFKKDLKIYELERLNNVIPYLPDAIQLLVRTRIDDIITPRVLKFLKDFSENHALPESHINSEVDNYKRVSPKTFEDEKRECIVLRRLNWFKSRQGEFRKNPSNTTSLDDLIKAYHLLDDEDGKHLEELRDTIKETVEVCMLEKQEAVVTICKRLQQEEGFSNLFDTDKMYNFMIRYLGEVASKMRNSEYMRNRFFEIYSVLMPYLDEEKLNKVRQEAIVMLKQTKLVHPFILSIRNGCDFFDQEEAYENVSQIVEQWSIEDVKHFVEHPVSMDDSRFSEIIFGKIFSFIESCRITDENESIKPVYQYCLFLFDIRKLAERYGYEQRWVDFIKTRNDKEIWFLYRYDALKFPTEETAKIVINAIDLGWICEGSSNWYNPPALEDDTIIKNCIEKGYDLFSMAAGRLASMDLSDNANIPLAVFFTELLSKNRPDKINSDYYEIRSWEDNFSKNLVALKDSNANNKKLQTILWAVYSQTHATIDGLSELIGYLPPYLQIRCVKKLFQLIALNKIHYTAESLYNLINSGEKRICFPLEIVFAYLKLREKDPRATMTNEAMLQLLDNREDDHREWIGIREMITQCYGRVYVRERDNGRSSWGNDYYNGYIRETSEGILLYNPNKMIDFGGDDTKYNNKHFRSIDELIRITFKEGEYRAYRAQAGECYVFNKDKEIELYGIAKAYNLKYGHIQDYYPEVNADDEQDFCECRLSDKLDNYYSLPFNWCGNKPCFRAPLRFHVSAEWEDYTVLDFMRILNIPTDYTNAQGKTTKYGHYIILSSYLISFAKFYEHLFCRGCKKLLKPMSVSNFAYKAVTQFSCVNEQCKEYEKIVYLNHCFNTRCKATIDSRDSKTCPNGQYICPDCGACCSTENFRIRMHNLQTTGGEISRRLIEFVNNNNGHWEKDEYYCYKCGGKAEVIEGRLRCQVCHFEKNLSVYKSIRPTLEN